MAKISKIIAKKFLNISSKTNFEKKCHSPAYMKSSKRNKREIDEYIIYEFKKFVKFPLQIKTLDHSKMIRLNLNFMDI